MDSPEIPCLEDKALIVMERFGLSRKTAKRMIVDGRLTWFNVIDPDSLEEFKTKVKERKEFVKKVRACYEKERI